jgi:hypothetical protein
VKAASLDLRTTSDSFRRGCQPTCAVAFEPSLYFGYIQQQSKDAFSLKKGLPMLLLLGAILAAPANAQQSSTPAPPPTGLTTEQELAISVHNPFEDFVKVPLQSTIGFELGPHHKAGDSFNVQPLVLRQTVNKATNNVQSALGDLPRRDPSRRQFRRHHSHALRNTHALLDLIAAPSPGGSRSVRS